MNLTKVFFSASIAFISVNSIEAAGHGHAHNAPDHGHGASLKAQVALYMAQVFVGRLANSAYDKITANRNGKTQEIVEFSDTQLNHQKSILDDDSQEIAAKKAALVKLEFKFQGAAQGLSRPAQAELKKEIETLKIEIKNKEINLKERQDIYRKAAFTLRHTIPVASAKTNSTESNIPTPGCQPGCAH